MTRRTKVKYAAIWAFWTVFGLYQVVQEAYRASYLKSKFVWYAALGSELSYGWLWALATPPAIRLTRKYPLGGRNTAQRILIHVAAMAGFAISVKLAFDRRRIPSNGRSGGFCGPSGPHSTMA